MSQNDWVMQRVLRWVGHRRCCGKRMRRVCRRTIILLIVLVAVFRYFTINHSAWRDQEVGHDAELKIAQRHLKLAYDAYAKLPLDVLPAERVINATSTKRWRLGIVRPFTTSQVDLLERRTRDWWRLAHAAPCQHARRKVDCVGDGTVELVFYYSATESAHVEHDSEFRERLLSATRDLDWIGTGRCVESVHFWSHLIKNPKADVHPDATCLAFYELMSRCSSGGEDTKLPFTHVFLMEPDVVPIRPDWLGGSLSRLTYHAVLDDSWIVGSISHDPVGDFRDYHINGNALFAVGDPAFVEGFLRDRVVPKYRRTARIPFADGCSGTSYGGFDVSFSRYLYDANMTRSEWAWIQRFLHRFRTTDVIVNMGNNQKWRPWSLLQDRGAHVALVHGKSANEVKNVWDPQDSGWWSGRSADNARGEWAEDVRAMASFLNHWFNGALWPGEHVDDTGANHWLDFPPSIFLEWVARYVQGIETDSRRLSTR